jgi:hypothetical protein
VNEPHVARPGRPRRLGARWRHGNLLAGRWRAGGRWWSGAGRHGAPAPDGAATAGPAAPLARRSSRGGSRRVRVPRLPRCLTTSAATRSARDKSTSTFLLAAGNLAGPPDDVERRHADVVRTATQAGLPPAGNLRVTGWPVAVLVTPSHGGDA